MSGLTKSRAIDLVGNLLAQSDQLLQLNSQAADFFRWKRSTEAAIRNIFGEESTHHYEFELIRFSPMPGDLIKVRLDEVLVLEGYSDGLIKARALLESILDEIEKYWLDDSLARPISVIQETTNQEVSNRVFVVHGRDDGTRNTVARFLETLGLEVVILQETPNEGKTIIEKFEDHSEVGFAVVLCTPDDIGALASDPDNRRARPRQNVVLELGFFLGRLGRNKVCALLQGDMEMPSDYGGVLFVPLDTTEGWKLTLARELRAAGMAIDMNRIA